MSLDEPVPHTSDVLVIGGGLAGMAASIHLARAGLSVTCLDFLVERDRIVGESLDWSGPALLSKLGLDMEQLVQSEIATYKRHVSLQLHDGAAAEYTPSPWLGKAPFDIELRTLHVDRLRLDAEIRRIANESGVHEVLDRAIGLEWNGRKIAAVVGESGLTYRARWFVDASGYAGSFLARQLNIPVVEYGPKKVAIWSYFRTPDWQESTTLYAESSPDSYLRWIWQIPIAPGETSVGLVASGPVLKEARTQGESVADLYRRHLEEFPHLQPLLSHSAVTSPRTTSFSCRLLKRVSGPNWFIAGEAAALPDPITGNGITSALRHASEAAHLIVKHHKSGVIPWLAGKMYQVRVKQVCRFFDSLIERLVYKSEMRDRFGLLKTGDVYTAVAWSMNHLYSRFEPRRATGTLLFCGVLSAWRALGWIAEQLCRALGPWFAPRCAAKVDPRLELRAE